MAVAPKSHRILLHGGDATRILIIDDDPRPASGRAGGDAVTTNGTANDGPPQPDFLEGEARPVIHEYQMATPVPLRPESDEVPAVPLETNGSTDVSVVRELVARVEELLHRTRALPAGGSAGWSGTIRFGSVMVEPATQTVLRGGQPVRVTHTEFRLLLALIRRRGAIASRIELLREVWGAGAAVSRRAVDTHIARLRRKVEDDPANPRHILTALAWGYRFRP
jgi:two-component system KDP operon response regulator KdpE